MQYIGLLFFFMLETGLICWLADNLKSQVLFAIISPQVPYESDIT